MREVQDEILTRGILFFFKAKSIERELGIVGKSLVFSWQLW